MNPGSVIKKGGERLEFPYANSRRERGREGKGEKNEKEGMRLKILPVFVNPRTHAMGDEVFMN